LILVGDAQLGQLPAEPRDFLVPLLEGCLHVLVRSTLSLQQTPCFLPRHALALEGGLGLSEGSPLLLELSLRLLACAPLLPKLLLCRDEGGGLVRQACLQLLCLLGLLLRLALPRPRPLEGCAVLLELGSSGSQLPLKLCRCNPHRGHVVCLL
jgi:hypothetical protein